MSRYKRRYGDRKEGRLLRSLPAFARLVPFIMPQRGDAVINYEESFEVSAVDRRLRQLRVAGYKGIGILHFIIAAYIRGVSMLPGLNRFVVGRRVFARDGIDVVMTIKRNISVEVGETRIKVHFAQTDTIFDVYRKINEKIEEITTGGSVNTTEEVAESISKAPKLLLQFIVWIFKIMDYFGSVPDKWLEISPFHGSVSITDVSSLHIDPVYRQIQSFGTVPLHISFGAKHHKYELNHRGEMLDNKYVDTKVSVDGRIAESQYFAKFLQAMRYMFQHPEIVENPPTKVIEDIY